MPYGTKPYEYSDPVENGFIKIKLSRKQHNKLFPKRVKRFSDHYDYYISDGEFVMHRTATLFYKIWITLLFPIVVIFGGLGNVKEIMAEYGDLYHEKERGTFMSDSCWARTDKYKAIVKGGYKNA